MMHKAVLEDTREISDKGEMISLSRSEKIQILTVLPKSWSVRKIETEFGASNRMARKAKEIVREKGILSSPDPKPGRTLSPQIVDLVTRFYESDETSRIMPGKRDCVSVRPPEGRVNVQKRLILSNLKELYSLFKDHFPGGLFQVCRAVAQVLHASLSFLALGVVSSLLRHVSSSRCLFGEKLNNLAISSMHDSEGLNFARRDDIQVELMRCPVEVQC